MCVCVVGGEKERETAAERAKNFSLNKISFCQGKGPGFSVMEVKGITLRNRFLACKKLWSSNSPPCSLLLECEEPKARRCRPHLEREDVVRGTDFL